MITKVTKDFFCVFCIHKGIGISGVIFVSNGENNFNGLSGFSGLHIFALLLSFCSFVLSFSDLLQIGAVISTARPLFGMKSLKRRFVELIIDFFQSRKAGGARWFKRGEGQCGFVRSYLVLSILRNRPVRRTGRENWILRLCRRLAFTIVDFRKCILFPLVMYAKIFM